MPILDVELVIDPREDPDDALAARLADEAGKVLGSEPGGTWVRLRELPRSRYAENGGVAPRVRPVFVTVLLETLPDEDRRAELARTLGDSIAEICERRSEHVHILFEPAARGRIAFGGTLFGGV